MAEVGREAEVQRRKPRGQSHIPPSSNSRHEQKDGTLEYHIPDAFTPERPGISYSHVEFNTRASEHPLASRIPKVSTRPAVVGGPDQFRDLMRPASSPINLADYTNSDIPQLGLHIVSFLDKTLVTIYWPHTLMDAMGKKELLDAWSLVIQGQDDEVRIPIGTETDPLEKLGRNPTEPHKLAAHQLGTFGLLRYGLGQLPNLFLKRGTRMVCIPSSFLSKLHHTAIAELAASGQENPFLSECDILCAWWTRLAVSHLAPSKQTIVLNNAYDIRKPLSVDLLPKGEAYISNATGFINVLLSLDDIISKPLSYTASRIREAIKELGTLEQVEAFYAMIRESSGKLPPFFGDVGMHMITYSNWSKARLFEVDFSAAIVERSEIRGQGTGIVGKKGVARPVYIQNNQFGLTLPNGFPIIGKDGEGNYWLSGYMDKGVWEGIEAMLEQDGSGEN
jgi:hypothetical protein